jgi:hypothetical protein
MEGNHCRLNWILSGHLLGGTEQILKISPKHNRLSQLLGKDNVHGNLYYMHFHYLNVEKMLVKCENM